MDVEEDAGVVEEEEVEDGDDDGKEGDESEPSS